MDRYTLLHRLHWAIAAAAFLAASCCTVLGLAWAVTHGGAGLPPVLAVLLGSGAGAICWLASGEADRLAREHDAE